MSEVRMCDRCGNIFSVREEDWSTYNGTRFRKDEKGRRVQESEQMDACPTCTGPSTVTPRLALDSATGVDRIAKTQTQADRDAIFDATTVAKE